MTIFVVRARNVPTAPGYVEKQLGGSGHFEIIAHSVVSSLFVSKDIRRDVLLYIVCEGPPTPPRVVVFDSRQMLSLPGFDEKSIVYLFDRALRRGVGLAKGECRVVDSGLEVMATSFERLVRSLAEVHPTYILDRKGEDARQADFPADPCFILTDHIPMQKKTHHLLKRLNVRKCSLGPRMLFAAHCIVLVHNELDRRDNPARR